MVLQAFSGETDMMIENNDGHAKDEIFCYVSMDFIIIDKSCNLVYNLDS